VRGDTAWARAFTAAVLPALLSGCRTGAGRDGTSPDGLPRTEPGRAGGAARLDPSLVSPAAYVVPCPGAALVLRAEGRPALRLLPDPGGAYPSPCASTGNDSTPAGAAGVDRRGWPSRRLSGR